MIPALLGKKVGMTQVFDDAGMAVPVTVIEAGPCTVLQVRTRDKDGYDAVQLGFEDTKPHRATKPAIGHAVKAGSTPKRFLREIRLTDPSGCDPGEVVTVRIFADQDVKYVDVAGTSKGRGFTGVMRRHGFGGQPGSHGTERKHRSPGSISGHGSDLGHGGNVKKGKRMAGQMGHDVVTVRNQKLRGVDETRNLLLVEGSVPGPNGGFVVVRKARTKG